MGLGLEAIVFFFESWLYMTSKAQDEGQSECGACAPGSWTPPSFLTARVLGFGLVHGGFKVEGFVYGSSGLGFGLGEVFRVYIAVCQGL